MSESIRFRMEGELCVLQVGEYDRGPYGSDKLQWRDAKATDLISIGEWLEAQRHIVRDNPRSCNPMECQP